MNSLRFLLPYLKPFRGLILVCVLLAIPLSAIRAAPAPMIKYVMDEVLVPGAHSKLIWIPILVVGLYALNFVVRFAHYYLLRIVIVRIDQTIRDDIFKHLMGLSAEFFSEKSTGSLISRSSYDPHAITIGLSTINVVIREPLTFVALFGYVLYLNWQLTLLTLLVFPPLAWLFGRTNKLVKKYIQAVQAENERATSTLQESYSGYRMIKSFRLEDYVTARYAKQNAELARQYLKISKIEEAAHPAVELLVSLVVAGLLWFGGRSVVDGAMTKGDLFAYFTAFGLMINPIRVLGDVNVKLAHASGACTRLQELFSWRSLLKVTEQPRPLRDFKNEILFDSVSFVYPDAPEKPILQDVSFKVQKGQTIAIVGASGAGKSSLVSLLPRIYDISKGSIRIDGTDIREYDLNHLRDQIAIVSQDVFLFNDTIEANIRCGRLGASFDEVKSAAERAFALEFIEAAPFGFKTVIGDRGQKLSGGQKQRLAIARAFLRGSPILILDEATSALDTASEKAVQAALSELMKDRTTLVIAHRLSTIQDADRIFVLHQGKVIEDGTHTDLMNRQGQYYRLQQQMVTE